MANIAALLLLEQDMNAEIDDTDTTNDDIHTTIIACIAAALYRVDKTRVSGYVETVVPYYSNESFRRKFRVSRATFNVMHNYVKRLPELQCEGDGGRENISTEKQLLLTLWYMGCSDNIDKIADRFGVSESSVIRCRNRVVKAILKHLKCRFIFWPKIADMQIVVDSFAERNGFPGIVGALDGTHIEIKTPGVNGASYINRKGYASLQLQAVCNHEMIFTDVFAGFPGSCHDARVLRNSDLWEDGLQLCNNVNNILADAAYALRRWLMTPYRDNGHLTPQQKRFNFNLSVNRVVIERAFGLLKGRFRRLRFLDTQKIETAVDVIVVCCILHNICIMHHDEVDDFMSRDEYAGNVVANNAVIQEQDGEGALKRIAITRMFE